MSDYSIIYLLILEKNFLIHTGFLIVETFKYKKNIIIGKNSIMKFYPCLDIECKNHNNNYMKNFTKDFVIRSIKKNLNLVNNYSFLILLNCQILSINVIFFDKL